VKKLLFCNSSINSWCKTDSAAVINIRYYYKMTFYSLLVFLLVLSCSICSSKPIAQSTNPCIALKLPLCRIKSDFADKHGITTKAPAPIRPTRPKLSSTQLLRQKSVTRPVSSNDQNSIKADDGTSLLSILRAKQSQRNSNKGTQENRDENDSCRGLRFCVLKKDASSNKRRPAAATPFVPTVRPSGFENLRVPLSSLQEDLSDNTFPSLLPLIRDGKIEEAKQFIEQGADVNEEDIHGNTLLLIAAQNGRDGIVEDLLLGGADVNKGNNHKNAAIHLAAQNGWTKVMEILLRAKNINVNFKDLHANTALHLAAQNGQIGIVSQLLERPEIELNAKNTHAHVPLHLSAQNGHLELSRILASKEGTNLDSKDLIGNTPLHTAYHTTHGKIANLLIQLGANKNARNLTGLRPQDLGRRRR